MRKKIIIKLFASSWYIFLTYIYDARSHLHQNRVIMFELCFMVYFTAPSISAIAYTIDCQKDW